MALELLKNSKPINYDKFCKITARLLYFFRQNYTLFVFYLSYFLYFEFWSTYFFLLFYNTLTNSNPEFQKFPVSKSITIRQNSQHVLRKQRKPNRNEKQNSRTSKDIIEIMFKNLYRSQKTSMNSILNRKCIKGSRNKLRKLHHVKSRNKNYNKRTTKNW